jgi:hypothetical protein
MGSPLYTIGGLAEHVYELSTYEREKNREVGMHAVLYMSKRVHHT